MRWINARPGRPTGAVLALAPFALLLAAYAIGSAARLADNANDKLLPGFSALAAAVDRVAFTQDVRTGDYILWADTLASLERLGAGLGLSTAIALVVGMLIGLPPYARAALAPLAAGMAMAPPLALLPILFIVMGLGEASKIALRVALPQILPRLITAVRLQLGPAWLFLIAAEAISADSGLGCRIILVRRYLAMDVIFPYVIWITLLAVLANIALDRLRIAAFPWSELEARR